MGVTQYPTAHPISPTFWLSGDHGPNYSVCTSMRNKTEKIKNTKNTYTILSWNLVSLLHLYRNTGLHLKSSDGKCRKKSFSTIPALSAVLFCRGRSDKQVWWHFTWQPFNPVKTSEPLYDLFIPYQSLSNNRWLAFNNVLITYPFLLMSMHFALTRGSCKVCFGACGSCLVLTIFQRVLFWLSQNHFGKGLYITKTNKQRVLAGK